MMVAKTQSSGPLVEGRRDGLLRQGMLADGIASGAVGVALIATRGWASDYTGLNPSWVPALIGASFLPWAANAFRLARQEPMDRRMSKIVIGGNLVYVLASYAILLFGLVDLTTAGKWTVAILAEIVALFALVQYLGLRRMRS